MDVWQGYPFALAVAFLFLVAMLRGQATYWLARTVTEQTLRRTRPTGGWRARVHTWLSSDTMGRGRVAVQRCGLPAVPLCYLTVGVQTVVLASAGVLRMRWLRFTLAQSAGALAWALLYSTIGFAFWAAFFEIAFASTIGTIAGVVAVLALVTALAYWRHVTRRRHRPAPAELGTPDPGTETRDASAATPHPCPQDSSGSDTPSRAGRQYEIHH